MSVSEEPHPHPLQEQPEPEGDVACRGVVTATGTIVDVSWLQQEKEGLVARGKHDRDSNSTAQAGPGMLLLGPFPCDLSLMILMMRCQRTLHCTQTQQLQVGKEFHSQHPMLPLSLSL